MKRFIPGLVLCCLMLLPGLASAQGQGWSVLSSQTVGTNNNVFYGQVGFPGLSFNILHGNSDTVDLGGRFAFNYSQEGMVDIIDPGLKLQGLVRVQLAKGGKVGLGLEFEPGVNFYFHGGGNTDIGLMLPINFVVGIPVSSSLVANARLDMPLQIYFGETVIIPVLFGGGLEYYLDSNLNLNFALKMGPSIATEGGNALFTMASQFGVAYKF
ncbi:hypothetical protein P2318_26460 [Myxococcaceae bacterium GXIMD 01537]